ncbi:MAG: DUF2480 family protein [Candidatus Zixiibacteriota bacterium]
MKIVDLTEFVSGELLAEKEFLENIDAFDWSRYQGRNVLIRGCADLPLPIWAFMAVTARLVDVARVIRYGNEHSNIVVYSRSS